MLIRRVPAKQGLAGPPDNTAEMVKEPGRGQQRGSRTTRRRDMGFMDKLRNRFHMSKGRAKQQAGRATDDPYLEAKGQSERVGGATRQVGEQAKDAGRNVRDAFKN
jgi:uncharacterized protein YjbJ (UPF0337 family)